MPSEGSKVKHIQLRFPVLPLMYCDFSGFPESFHNIMYVTWEKTYILCNVALRNVIFDLFDTSLVKFGTKWWAMIQFCWQRPRCSFYTQTWYLHLLPFTCLLWIVSKQITWIFYNLFTFILPLSQLFWNVLQLSKTKFVHIYKIHLRCSENFGNLFFVLLSIK